MTISKQSLWVSLILQAVVVLVLLFVLVMCRVTVSSRVPIMGYCFQMGEPSGDHIFQGSDNGTNCDH